MITSCSDSNSAESVAKRTIQAMNEADYNSLWGLVSDKSKAEIEQQLHENKKTLIGKKMISQVANIDIKDINNFGSKEYFSKILSYAKEITPNGLWESKFVSVDVKGNVATIKYRKSNGVIGYTPMQKESGKWKVDVDVV